MKLHSELEDLIKSLNPNQILIQQYKTLPKAPFSQCLQNTFIQTQDKQLETNPKSQDSLLFHSQS